MSITAGGFILLLLGLFAFLRAPRQLPYMVVFFAPFSATAVINLVGMGYKSGGLGITPATFCLILFFVAQLVFGLAFRPVIVSAGLLIQVGLLAAFMVTFLVSLLWHGVNDGLTSYQLTQSVYVMLGAAATVLFAFEFCRDGAIDKVVQAMRATAIFCSFWGIVQLGCFYIGIPYPSQLFNNSLSDGADMFNQYGEGFMRIASVAVEPSFFAASMLHFVSFGITILLAEPRLRTAAWISSVVFSTAVLLLSTSSTGYFGLAVLSLLLLTRWPQASVAVGIPTVLGGIFAILAVPTIGKVLEMMTINKTDTESYMDRAAGAIEGFRVFMEHPLFGGGWGAASNFNSITATLGNVGVIGTLIFLLACVATLYELQSQRSVYTRGTDWRLSAYGAGVQNALVVSFACSISSGIKYVVLDDWCFWAFGIAIASRLHVVSSQSVHNRNGAIAVSAPSTPQRDQPHLVG